MRFPLFSKPCNEGSSMGITASSFCEDETALRAAIDRLSQYGPVLIEEFLSGDEYTVGIIDGEPIGVMQVLPRLSEKPPRPATGDQRPFIYSLDVKRDYLKRVEYKIFRDE
ncbi:MAG TPA: hypothetical protein VIM68_00520, partial [Thermoanaerobaculia bacterium]